LATGFTCAVLSFDYDADPNRRRLQPDFYGAIQDGLSRTLFFLVMIVNSSSLLLLRSFGAAMLMSSDHTILLYFLLFDQCFYFLQKIARGDFWYFIPADGVLGFVISVCFRLLNKVVVDFVSGLSLSLSLSLFCFYSSPNSYNAPQTGIIQFRHPIELGGIYYSFNLCVSVVFSFMAIDVFYKHTKVNDRLISENTAWLVMGLVCATWVVSFLFILLLMKNKYRSTFFSLKTGKQSCMDFFSSKDEYVKKEIFSDSTRLWKSIAPEVKVWVGDNWWRWEKEKPDWFTDDWKEKVLAVGSDWVPIKASVRNGRKGERRSSISALNLARGLKTARAPRRLSSAEVVPVVDAR
jgi:hypothetical protein